MSRLVRQAFRFGFLFAKRARRPPGRCRALYNYIHCQDSDSESVTDESETTSDVTTVFAVQREKREGSPTQVECVQTMETSHRKYVGCVTVRLFRRQFSSMKTGVGGPQLAGEA